MIRIITALALGASLAIASLPVEAAVVGVPSTGNAARVSNSIAQTQQRNNAAISHVQNSIAATRRNQF